MKASYKGFEAKRAGGFTELPPVGAYVAEIKSARFVPKKEEWQRDKIELYLDIIEGEFKDRFTEVYNDQVERFGSDVSYKGKFYLVPPVDGDEDWRKRTFEGNLWCVEQSNDGYSWDWHEEKLKGKKVGISLRKRLYTYNKKDRETVEIACFETVDDVKNGKCKPKRERDQREKHDDTAVESADDESYENVTKDINVPWA